MKRVTVLALLTLVTLSASGQQYGWQVASRPSTLACGAIEFVDSLNGWINFFLDIPPRILRTRDGGYTWTPTTLPSATNGITSISFVDTIHGWAVSFDGHIFATIDGGQTWTLQHYPQSRRYSSNASLTNKKSLAGGARTVNPDTGFINESTNAGNVWYDETFQNVRGVGALDFVDTLLGWSLFFSGGAQWILRTHDGGISWDTKFVRSRDVILTDVEFTDTLNGSIFADTRFASLIYHTTDGGVSWTKEAFNLTAGIGPGRAIDRFHAWAGSDNGTILKYGVL